MEPGGGGPGGQPGGMGLVVVDLAASTLWGGPHPGGGGPHPNGGGPHPGGLNGRKDG